VTRGASIPHRPGMWLVVCVLLTASVAGPRAQVAPAQPPQIQSVENPATVGKITLTAGRSTVLETGFDIVRVAVTDPAIADATVVQPRELLIDGKGPGTVSVIIWGSAQRVQYDVMVEGPISTLQHNLQALFPGEDIQVNLNDEAIVLTGHASSTAVMLKAGEIAQASSSKNKVINLLQLPGGVGSQQVMLQVRFAEVNGRAVQELGASFFVGPNSQWDWAGRSTTAQFAAPNVDQSGTTFSDLLNLFVFNTKYNAGAVIRALKDSGYFQSLAEPNLIAYNGREASFLAGGEYPYPVVQGGVGAGAIQIQWKEFGVRLKFTPTIAGDIIRLKVEPEVSSLDYNNGITLSGFRVPALTTRRASTEVELRDGQSFAIAGLLNNISQDDKQGIPLLSSIPVIGYLFQSKAQRKERTELLVLITPQLVRPLEPDEVPPLPTNLRRFLPGSGIGGQLEGGGGLVDAPAVKPKEPAKPAPPPVKKGG
jgi:pilus assembly protein CpaC